MVKNIETLDICVDPAIANLPFEGFPVFKDIKVNRVLQKLQDEPQDVMSLQNLK